MKLGIVTPYDSANYGAYLQAYATMQYLKSLGHEVVFIKFRSDEQRKQIFFPKTVSIKAKFRTFMRRKHMLEHYSVMTKSLELFPIVKLDDLPNAKLDAIIVGSDEIWNVKVATFQNPIFYGVNYIPCFAYAPSMGNASEVDFQNFPELVKKIKEIRIIGVRDENTRRIVEQFRGETPAIVCDPTCLLEPGQYPTFLHRKISEQYLLVYAYTVPKALQEKLQRYARERGLKLVSACMHHAWCDKSICCAPLEFYSLISHAQCVFTSTFHGTIFSLMQHKKCAVYASSKKLNDLIQWTKMDCVRVEADPDFELLAQKLDVQPDYTNFVTNMSIRRAASRKLYKTNLEALV